MSDFDQDLDLIERGFLNLDLTERGLLQATGEEGLQGGPSGLQSTVSSLQRGVQKSLLKEVTNHE